MPAEDRVGMMITLHRGALFDPVQQRIQIISAVHVVLAQRLGQPVGAADQGQDHLVGPGRERQLHGHRREHGRRVEPGTGLEGEPAEGLEVGEHLSALIISTQGDQGRPRPR